MSETELKRTEVDLAGLMEVLGKNLYSTTSYGPRVGGSFDLTGR